MFKLKVLIIGEVEHVIKKWTKYILFGLMLFVIVACQSADQTTTSLIAEENGLTVELTFVAEGDLIVRQKSRNEISYESLGVSSPEEAEDMLAEFMVGYDTTEGIEHQVDYQDDRVIETVEVDFETVDVDEASQLAGSIFEGDPSEGISLEATVEMLQELGFEIVD